MLHFVSLGFSPVRVANESLSGQILGSKHEKEEQETQRIHRQISWLMYTLQLCSFVFLQHFDYYFHSSFEMNTKLIFISAVARNCFNLLQFLVYRKLESL